MEVVVSHVEPVNCAAAGPLVRIRDAVRRRFGRGPAKEAEPGEGYESFPRWPVVALAAGAFVAIWGGWVDLGQMAGFGPVNLLPGIMDLTVNLAITLPLGMEVYAAFVLGVWLTHRNVRPAARTFAGWSVLASLVIGAAGQITYHLLHAAGIERAPWQVVVGVACVPVAVMGMGAALAHLLGVRRPRAAARVVEEPATAEAGTPTDPASSTTEPVPIPKLVPMPAVVEPVVVAASRAQEQPAQELDPATMTTAQRDAFILELARDARSERDIAARVPWSRSTVNRVLRKHDVVLNPPNQARLEWATDRGEAALA
jgi:hypothetical protein